MSTMYSPAFELVEPVPIQASPAPPLVLAERSVLDQRMLHPSDAHLYDGKWPTPPANWSMPFPTDVPNKLSIIQFISDEVPESRGRREFHTINPGSLRVGNHVTLHQFAEDAPDFQPGSSHTIQNLNGVITAIETPAELTTNVIEAGAKASSYIAGISQMYDETASDANLDIPTAKPAEIKWYKLKYSNGMKVSLLIDESQNFNQQITFRTANSVIQQRTPQEQIKHFIKANIRSRVGLNRLYHRTGIGSNIDGAEAKARMLLRDMISEAEWRRYVTNGFVMVKGDSGKWYQIFSNHGLNVYLHNKRVASVCIHTDRECPPTDHVINMKALVELDEASIPDLGNWREFKTNENSELTAALSETVAKDTKRWASMNLVEITKELREKHQYGPQLLTGS